jgi:hypothetical protein
MNMRPAARFGVATGLLVVTFLIAAAVHLGATDTAWAVVLAAGLLGAGLTPSLSMQAALGVLAWAWFTGFVQPRSGELSFAGDDVQRLLVFTVSTVALAVFIGRIHHVIKENAHG